MDTSGRTRREFIRDAAILAAGGAAASAAGGGAAYARDPIERTQGPRLKLSCAAYSYRRYLGGDNPAMTVEEFLDACAAMDLDGVELTGYYFPQPVTDEYLHHIKRTCYLLGLDISGTGHRNNFCRPPGPDRDKDIAWVKQWIDHARVLGAPFCRIYAGGVQEGQSHDDTFKWCVEAIQEVSEYGGTRGVMCGLETHGGLTATGEETQRILEAVKSDWLGLNLDIANFHTEDPYADTELVAKYAITVHLKTEAHPAGQDKQPMDFQRVIDIMRGVNYRGYLTIEHEANEDPAEAVPRYAKILRGLLE
ncbi:MAG: sugar phosphate isomerase/epimerase [Armatimonadota bacterium]|nr:MAG: sugar phosphate isomerase/epimerase [Armatimonadota bacterium]